MRLNVILFIIFYSYFICPSLSLAARPLSTDDAGVVDKGHFEMEGSLEYTNQLDKEVALCVVVKRGIFDNLDLGIEIPYKFIDLICIIIIIFLGQSVVSEFPIISSSAQTNNALGTFSSR